MLRREELTRVGKPRTTPPAGRRWRGAAFAAAALCFASPGPAVAAASGGVRCEARGGGASVHLRIAAPRTAGGQPSTLESRIESVKPDGPPGLASFRFQVTDLRRHEVDPREGNGRVGITLERPLAVGASLSRVRLDIDAPAVQEAFYKGRYRLTVSGAQGKAPFAAEGSITCSSD